MRLLRTTTRIRIQWSCKFPSPSCLLTTPTHPSFKSSISTMLINYDQASFSTIAHSNLNPYERIEHQFEAYAGSHAMQQLRESVTSNLVITLGGDQLTGKSTLSKRLQQHLDAKLVSAGTFFRARASELGISVPALSRQALSDPSIDISIDYSLCSAICKGEDRKVLILEGRQPSVMATFMNLKCKKERIIRIYLYCSPLEQALRFMEREVGPEEFSIAKNELRGKEWKTLHEIGKEIRRLPIRDAERIATTFSDNDERDADDRRRYAELYSQHPLLDYRNRSLYDIIIDTTTNTPEDTYKQALKALSSFNLSSLLWSKL